MATSRTEDLEGMSRTDEDDAAVKESVKASVAAERQHETGVELTPLENGHLQNDQQASASTTKPSAQDKDQKQAAVEVSPTRSSHRKSRSQLATAGATIGSSDRRLRHHRAGSERHMGHYPPRQAEIESRQESPPTAFVVDAQSSQLTESWNDISNQFEESVGKPSREALHKFFYPPGNNNNSSASNSLSAHHQEQAIQRRRLSQGNVSDRSLGKRKGKTKARKSTTEIPQQPQSSHSHTGTNHNEENNNGGDSSQTTGSEEPRNQPLPQTLSSAEPQNNNSAPQITTDVNPSNQNQVQSQESQTTFPQQQLRQQPQPIHSSLSRNSSFDSLPGSGGIGQLRSSSALQHSFDVEEEEDRKYVERFWTIYDDIIMLSLFTNLGVVARLAASTWFTFFDGVFRADSPLFTNLPLNCMSCFLLGLLGSGERLMETVTTRFTPRNLQQSIIQDRSSSGENNNNNNEAEGGGCYMSSDDNDENHNYYDDYGDDTAQGLGLRQRRNRGGRRPKRNKRKKAFHSWQPPLHWHDDLREVQLLALERRIRASKCLLLFPVAKEDADVMEHYFGEGYKASVGQQQGNRQPQQQSQQQRSQNVPRRRSRRRRRRRGFERQKYAATNLADTDSADSPSPRHQRVGFDDSESCDDDESDLDDNGEYQRNQNGEGVEDDDEEYEDDGLFRFDLELTESTEMSPPVEGVDVGNGAANGLGTPSSRMQKLIKRAPGRISEPALRQMDAPPATTHSHLETQPSPNATMPHSRRTEAVAAPIEPNQPLRTDPAPAQPQVAEEAVPSSLGTPVHETSLEAATQPRDSYLVAVVRSAAGVPINPDTDNHSLGTASGGEGGDPQLEQIISNVQANVSENISRLGRVNLADGWDVGTTPEAMADDLMLGLRDGFCGALSSFSSWNSSMLNLLREGHIGDAFVGYLLGLQLPIVAYRFGQQVAVYFFVWRCRREARREARKGWYGIRVKMDGSDDESDEDGNRRRERTNSGESSVEEFFDERSRDKSAETLGEDPSRTPEVPSVRAICTALYLLALVTQFTSLSFFTNPEDQQIALSLLFSPVGTLTRWRLSQYNTWRPGFPIGTFACNILACALSGSLGSVLAGNPGPKERIFLQSFIAGFGGTLSSMATFIVEILAGMDPLLFRFDGVIYAVCTIAWALIVGFVFSASVDWADETT